MNKLYPCSQGVFLCVLAYGDIFSNFLTEVRVLVMFLALFVQKNFTMSHSSSRPRKVRPVPDLGSGCMRRRPGRKERQQPRPSCQPSHHPRQRSLRQRSLRHHSRRHGCWRFAEMQRVFNGFLCKHLKQLCLSLISHFLDAETVWFNANL